MTSQPPIHRLIIIDRELFDNSEFVDSLNQNFNVPVEFEDLKSLETGLANDAENGTVGLYISSSFDGPVFECLLTLQKPVISDIVVKHCIQNRVSLPIPKHPLFNYFMKDFIICFSIDDKRQTHTINKYLNLIRFMGGQSRRDMKTGKSFERTHLIDSRTDSVNYRLACIYEIPVLYKEWVDHFWEHRRDPDFDPNDESHLLKFRIKPFADLRITLYNFPDEDMEKFSNLIQESGGQCVPLYDENTTHLVVRNESESDYLEILNNFPVLPKFIVSEMWLENCLRLNCRDPEEQHQLKIPLDDRNLSEICTPTKDDHSTLNSFLSPNYDNSIVDDCSIVDKNDMKKQAIVQELYQTEMNYVQILKDIIRIFLDPLKNHQMPGQFPNEIELKTIFGGLPPIIDVHEKILSELEPVAKNWKAENEIGKIFQKHSQNFLTVYPQYVNFYEKTKETIDECINKYPKFNSFLKACQTSSECRKQTFQELLINPIQRLPRIELYLRTLLERTDKLHPDFKPLNEALETIVTVNRVINNEKKKTENQMELFELLNDIEDCPATLVSAHRHFIAKCDVKLLVPNPSNETDNVTVHKLENYHFSLLLFTDWILVCKKRVVKRTNSLRDRTPNLPLNVNNKKSKKSYRYIETVELIELKQIFKDFEEQDTLPDFHEAFALVSNNKDPTGNYFLIYPFVAKDAVMNKEKFVQSVVKAFEKLIEKPVDSEFVKRTSFGKLDWSHSKTIARSLSKSKYVIMRTKERLNRTFTMRRAPRNLLSVSMENLTAGIPSAPSSSRLSRVFNNLNFFSPRENGYAASPNTNRTELFSDINELDHSTDDGGDNFSLPATPAPRKKKTLYQD